VIYLLPWEPWPAVYMAALFLTCGFAVRRDAGLWPVAAIMLGNWAATRCVTAFDLSGTVQAAADISSAAGLLLLPKQQSVVVLPAAALFALMLVFSACFDAGIIGRDTLWAWSDVLGYGQLLVIAGGAAAGGRNRRLGVAVLRRHGNRGLDWPVAARLQDPPSS
jgi:hypothetical protein